MHIKSITDFDRNTEINIIDTKYGKKIQIKTPYYLKQFVEAVKKMDYEKTHRKYNGNGWEFDLESKQYIQNILKTNGFERTAEKLDEIKTVYRVFIDIDNRASLYPLSLLKNKYPDFFKEVRHKIGFKHPNERTIRKYSTKDLSNWDGYVFPAKYDWKNNKLIFDVSYVDTIKEMIENNNIKVIIRDKRATHKINGNIKFNLELWRPQKEAVEKILDELIKKGSCLYQLPTGLGKTECAFYIIYKLKVKTCILVNSKDLLYQWYERAIDTLGIEPGIVGDGNFNPSDITIATVQSLWNYIKEKSKITLDDISLVQKFIEKGEIDNDFVPDINDEFFNMFSLIILDEVHIGAADTFLAVLRSFKAKYFLGQSATTWRTDRMHPLLWGIFGRPKFEYDINKAIEDGYLVRPIIKIIKTNIKYYEDSYNRVIHLLKTDPERNMLIAELARDAPKPCLILTNQITHQKEIAKAMKNLNIRCVFLNGGDDMKTRNEVLNKLKKGKIDIVCTTPIWNQGVNIPNLRSIIFSFPFKSDVQLIQKIGRAIRKSENKETCIIYDLVDDNRILRNQFEERLDVYKKFGWI